ncbi:MAG: prepilin-type N-terminal cleavage/methylation domain-containing protein [Actinobacteria bacterium]|nr:prepilin-type N-terminal cleavage/methylation domain-containing protein [Actinomycetota bacterium]
MLNKILLRKIKFPLSLRGTFPHVIARERSDRSNLSYSGFSLIELMVAVAILAMAIFGIFLAFNTGFQGMTDSRDRTVATNYVQEKMEELKNADFDTVVPDNDESFGIVGDIKFRRNVNVEYIDGNTNSIVLYPTNLKRVTTTVKWDDRKGDEKKVVSSVLIQNTQFTPGDAARISLYAEPYNVVLPVTSSTTIIAVIKDSSGNTIFDWNGSDVTFTIASGNLLGTLSDYAVTPVQGRASVILTSSGTEEDASEGTMIIEASATTADGSNTFTNTIDIDVTWGAVKIKLTPNPSSILADGITQSTITATIQNAAGGTVDDGTHDIIFTITGEGTLIGLNPVTSDLGLATVTLQSKLTAGIATVTASSPGLFDGSCDVRTSGLPAGITLSASPNPMYSDDISTVTVTIVDENDIPVIPTTPMTINFLPVSGGALSESSLEFNNVSVRTTNYTPFLSTEGIVTITATGAFGGSIDISVELKLEADHIELNANPPSIPADGGDSSSTITATIKSSGNKTVHNYIGNVTFSILSALGETFFGSNPIDCDDGVATIQLKSGSVPGVCQVQVESGTLPIETIDVGFYTTATHILLTAAPVHIPVGGGNEGTSLLTARIKDSEGTTVYNYDGDVLFSFLSGYNSTAKFKFVTQPNYSVPVFHGSASVYLLSLNNSGDASLEANSDSLFPDELTLYIQKVIREPDIPHIVPDANGKGVSFDIEVLGGDIEITDMMVSWSPDSGEQLGSIKFGNNLVFSGTILSGEDIDITDTILLEGTSTIYLGFSAGITAKDITIIFYPSVSNYHADSYEISF